MEHSPWFRRIVVVSAVLVTAILQRLTPPELAHWHDVFPQIYFLPIIFAALADGWRGGSVIALISSVALFMHIPASPPAQADSMMSRSIEAFTFCCVGILTGVLADRERRQKKQYQELAAQLGAVYEKLQANFEGMKRAERLSAIGQLSAGLAHEIRNPLASIAGAAAILQRGQTLDQKQSRCLDIITGECQRLDGLLTNFLNFARPRPPRFQTVKLEPLLENVLALASHAVRSKSIQLRRESPLELPSLDCDPEQLEQVLLNLMINAIEASPEGGAVTLSAGVQDNKIGVRVIDQGGGVAPGDIDRLFDPFFTTKENGTGLGLSVAHQIIRQLGGALSAQRNVDRGMTFSVVLPIRRLPA